MEPDPKPPRQPGPEPDHLKLEGPWEDRVSDALKKPRPPEGWPKMPGKGTKPRQPKPKPDQPKP
jgi:hypothetical protein